MTSNDSSERQERISERLFAHIVCLLRYSVGYKALEIVASGNNACWSVHCLEMTSTTIIWESYVTAVHVEWRCRQLHFEYFEVL
jgi:hypothetical protein